MDLPEGLNSEVRALDSSFLGNDDTESCSTDQPAIIMSECVDLELMSRGQKKQKSMLSIMVNLAVLLVPRRVLAGSCLDERRLWKLGERLWQLIESSMSRLLLVKTRHS